MNNRRNLMDDIDDERSAQDGDIFETLTDILVFDSTHEGCGECYLYVSQLYQDVEACEELCARRGVFKCVKQFYKKEGQ